MSYWSRMLDSIFRKELVVDGLLEVVLSKIFCRRIVDFELKLKELTTEAVKLLLRSW